MAVLSFRDLDVWQAAMDLAVATHRLADHLPTTQRFELASQLRRAATSVPSNIAEGHGRKHDPVFLHHIMIALGSLAELETQIELAVRLHLLERHAVNAVRVEISRTGKLLHGWRRRLRSSITATGNPSRARAVSSKLGAPINHPRAASREPRP